MRVTKVELRADGSSDVIELSFRDPKSLNPYQALSISPLDADDITPRFYGSGVDGQKYYQMSLKKREPVVLIGLNPRYGEPDNNSYSELRDRLYRLISASRTGIVQLRFINGGTPVAAVSGRFMKAETSHFTDKPQFQITLKCTDPMLKSLARVNADLDAEGFTNSSPIVTDNQSTAPHGFRFVAQFTTPESEFVMTDGSDEWAFTVAPTGGFLSGDALVFSSEHKDKELHILRGMSKILIADRIQAGSIWPILHPGENQFFVEGSVNWISITHFLTYWGV